MKYIKNYLNIIPPQRQIIFGGCVLGAFSVIMFYGAMWTWEHFFSRHLFQPWLKSFVLIALSTLFITSTGIGVALKYIWSPLSEKLGKAQIQIENAEARARAKMDFLSRMSHEIRTPLGAITGFAHLLENAKLREDERKYLDSINMSGKFLLRIINDILDLSKIEAGGIELEPAPFDLSNLTKMVSQMMEAEAISKGIDLNLDCAGIQGKTLTGDRHRIQQILMNLVGNAIKFTKEGSVTLRTKAVINDQSAKIRFEVEDTGIGMTPEQLKKIFMPFAQGDAAISRQFGGTGLGLSISKQLVEKMGGKIDAESEKDKGSTFSFELNLSLSDETEAVREKQTYPVREDTESKHTLRILVAEDEAVNRMLIAKFFKVLGYPLEFALDGQDCIDRLSGDEIFDAIFLDLHMPHYNGMEIAEKIKKGGFGESTKHAKLAIMSADVFAGQQGKDIGADSFISKPISIEALKTCLESVSLQEAKPRTLNALIVEDQELNRNMIGQIFASFGMRPNFASDGIECIEFLEANRDIDLILLDLRMPRMDGWTVAKKIRNGEAGADFSKIPIAVVSGEIHARDACHELGVDEFIAKPFEVNQIRDFVNRVGEKNGIALSN